jgi:hypothetical protein
MAQLAEAAAQILAMHAQFIHAVVNAAQNRALLAQLEPVLKEAETRGWGMLVGCVRRILNGQRDRAVLLGLDDEDRVIAEAILGGIDNPASLPPLDSRPSGAAAAPGLAAMIQAAGRGDVQAFTALANMAEQMLKGGGDMARLGGIMRRLVDGERDPDLLGKGMGPLGRQLLLDILDQLAKSNLH